MGTMVREKMIMMGVYLLLLLLSYNLVSSLADVQENNMERRMTNEKVLAGEGHDIVSINRRATGGGHSASASHGSRGGARGGRGYTGGATGSGGGNGGNPTKPGNIGVIPIYAAGAANNNRYNQPRRNAAATPDHSQIGFISLRTGLILAILVSFII